MDNRVLWVIDVEELEADNGMPCQANLTAEIPLLSLPGARTSTKVIRTGTGGTKLAALENLLNSLQKNAATDEMLRKL